MFFLIDLQGVSVEIMGGDGIHGLTLISYFVVLTSLTGAVLATVGM